MIKRVLEKIIQSKLGTRKAFLLMGARQVGKTTLLFNLFRQNPAVLWLNGDEKDGVINAYEFKWNPVSKHSNPKLFLNAYPESSF